MAVDRYVGCVRRAAHTRTHKFEHEVRLRETETETEREHQFQFLYWITAIGRTHFVCGGVALNRMSNSI